MKDINQSVLLVEHKVLQLLEKGCFGAALACIRNFVLGVFDRPDCVGNLFGSKKLDELCRKIGVEFTRLHIDVSGSEFENDANTIVYLVSKLQRSGGHSKLVVNNISNNQQSKHIIISTEFAGPSDFDFVNQLTGLPNVAFISVSSWKGLEYKFHWLLTQMLIHRGASFYLLNYHFDSLIASAALTQLFPNLNYIHHADHHLALGVFLQGVKHIDPHRMGAENCKQIHGLDNYYLPMHVECGDYISQNLDQKRSATVARINKLDVFYYPRYFTVIPALLAANRGWVHYHAGYLPFWYRLLLKVNLLMLGVEQSKFNYIPHVPNVSDFLKQNSISLFISSFPVPAALTMLEVAASGIPIAAHNHASSWFLRCHGLLKPVFYWDSESELINFVKKYNSNQMSTIAHEAFLNVKKENSDYTVTNFHHASKYFSVLEQSEVNVACEKRCLKYAPYFQRYIYYFRKNVRWLRYVILSRFF